MMLTEIQSNLDENSGGSNYRAIIDDRLYQELFQAAPELLE